MFSGWIELAAPCFPFYLSNPVSQTRCPYATCLQTLRCILSSLDRARRSSTLIHSWNIKHRQPAAHVMQLTTLSSTTHQTDRLQLTNLSSKAHTTYWGGAAALSFIPDNNALLAALKYSVAAILAGSSATFVVAAFTLASLSED